MKPVIGVTPLYDEERDSIWMLPAYLDLIEVCGGLPIVLPLEKDNVDIPQLLLMCDGVMLTGGHDVSPALYGEAPLSECGEPNPWRDSMEMEIIQECLNADKPVFGICRGLQLLNVALGGDLYQDLPTQYSNKVSHKMPPPYSKGWHEVILLEKKPLSRLLSTASIEVNSYHHQGIRTLASSLVPMAETSDGLIEAAYLPHKRFVWGVQWHPEYSYSDDVNQVRILKKFVSACTQ